MKSLFSLRVLSRVPPALVFSALSGSSLMTMSTAPLDTRRALATSRTPTRAVTTRVKAMTPMMIVRTMMIFASNTMS